MHAWTTDYCSSKYGVCKLETTNKYYCIHVYVYVIIHNSRVYIKYAREARVLDRSSQLDRYIDDARARGYIYIYKKQGKVH